MSNPIVPSVYKWVIDDVIEKMSVQFAHMGIDESVLQELQGIWEHKLIASRVAPFPEPVGYNYINEAAVADGDQYQHHDGYGSSQNMYPNSAAHLASLAAQGNPMQQQQQYQQQQQQQQQGDPNNLYFYRLNQTDGADDDLPQEPSESLLSRSQIDQKLETLLSKRIIPQRDGPGDSDEGSDDDNNNNAEEQSLNSDLDSEDSQEEVETDHIILCQYEKVTRIKNKWKTIFKDGVMNINGKDYLFNKTTGEFEW